MQNIDKVIQEADFEDLFGLVVNDLFQNVCRDLETFVSYSQRMTQGERMVILIWCLSCEAANGGISQFLTNDSGDDFDETREHLARIGANAQVDAFDRVVKKIFGDHVPVERDKRCQLLWSFSGEDSDDPDWAKKEEEAEQFFDEIDELFGWCESVKKLATEYIIKNPSEFNDAQFPSRYTD